MGQVIYTPPDDHATITALLNNWEQFLHVDDDLDPLVKLAILHYQFEAIHPYFDGNGRTGRIINILFLIEKGLLDLPILYLNRYILSNKTGYYQGLLGVTEHGDWQTWVSYILNAITETSQWTTAKILAIKELHAITAHGDDFAGFYQLIKAKRSPCPLPKLRSCPAVGSKWDANLHV